MEMAFHSLVFQKESKIINFFFSCRFKFLLVDGTTTKAETAWSEPIVTRNGNCAYASTVSANSRVLGFTIGSTGCAKARQN